MSFRANPLPWQAARGLTCYERSQHDFIDQRGGYYFHGRRDLAGPTGALPLDGQCRSRRLSAVSTTARKMDHLGRLPADADRTGDRDPADHPQRQPVRSMESLDRNRSGDRHLAIHDFLASPLPQPVNRRLRRRRPSQAGKFQLDSNRCVDAPIDLDRLDGRGLGKSIGSIGCSGPAFELQTGRLVINRNTHAGPVHAHPRVDARPRNRSRRRKQRAIEFVFGAVVVGEIEIGCLV